MASPITWTDQPSTCNPTLLFPFPNQSPKSVTTHRGEFRDHRHMPSIEDVVAGVRAVLDRVSTARKNLLRVLNSWENAGCTYASLGEGSTQPDLGNAAAYLE